MRLKNIKLVGFKSFVDLTKVSFPGNLTGIVGPNGCGKSNVIDAVRWVMGESSAKYLRGESLADVIFNGSTGRKPVGQASIELNFDNSDGSLGGEYAAYAEISIRRQITRDGQSNYFLNGVRCRRKDITDIFLGTGLGPRSYAIIEQGTVSRLIEAKPDEMRQYLEEVAGISKYKERRRETENRIRHTRENLERLNDLREELDKQLAHLKRQANAAERYKELKAQEWLLKGRLYALRWQIHHAQLEQQTAIISKQEVELEAHIAQLRENEATITLQQEERFIANENFNKIQERYYGCGSEIARIQQTLKHNKERYQQLTDDQAEVELRWQEICKHQERDKAQILTLEQQVTSLLPELTTMQMQTQAFSTALIEAEHNLQVWQTEWENFNQDAAVIAQNAQVAQTRIQALEEQIQTINQRLQRVNDELFGCHVGELPEEIFEYNERLAELNYQIEAQQTEISEQLIAINTQRQANHQTDQQLSEIRSLLQRQQGQYASLHTLQQAALGQHSGLAVDWLKKQGLQDKPRLAQSIKVEPGWERAVETVLDFQLQAVCVDSLTEVVGNITEWPAAQLAFAEVAQPAESSFQAHPLMEKIVNKVHADYSVAPLLASIYGVDSLPEALALLDHLAVHESIITREGIWLGPGWLRINYESDEKTGILRREQELTLLSQEINATTVKVEELQDLLQTGRQRQQALEEQREEQQQSITELNRERTDIRAQLQVKTTRLEQLQHRQEELEEELSELTEKRERQYAALQDTRQEWQASLTQMSDQTEQRIVLQQQGEANKKTLSSLRQQAAHNKDMTHQINLNLQTARAELQTLQQNSQRVAQQLVQLEERKKFLEDALENIQTPRMSLEEELESALNQRLEVEDELSTAKQQVEAIEYQLRTLETQRRNIENQLSLTRDNLEKLRLDSQTLQVRCMTLQEQLQENNYDLNDLLLQLPTDNNQLEEEFERSITDIEQRIQRLGPINLMAIDEYTSQSERKTYLDEQNADLEEALTTLETAMHKIDRETRARFKETFDHVNLGLQTLFPRIFGGGKAYLALTEEDLLNTGISIMAQPPGKKNSTIHLLSGGEKALTALALVFALFQLNPAPFCMLDEVDAPLDEANVVRFCNLVKEMAEKVQFIIISHNKVTIEMMHHLAGVTMQEPGVSRLVAVDVAEAVALAEA